MVQIRLYGDDFPYLLIFIIIFAIALVILYFARLAVRYQPKVTPPAIQKEAMVIGTGMACNDILKCSGDLQCFNGKCLSPIGGKCSTIYDCVGTAKACNGICLSSSDAGDLGQNCPYGSVGYCNPPYECLLSTETTSKCLVPDGRYGCSSNDQCSFNYRCQSNQCVPSNKPGEACTSDDQCGGGDKCISGYCEPPNTQPGSLGAYCYGMAVGGTPECGTGLYCNILSSDLNEVYYIGKCVDSFTLVPFGERCSPTVGCINPGICSDGFCIPPNDPSDCGPRTSGSCVGGYQCTLTSPTGGAACLGENGSSCSFSIQCQSNSCSGNNIYSINTNVVTPYFPIQNKLYPITEPYGGRVTSYRLSSNGDVRSLSYGVAGEENKIFNYFNGTECLITLTIDGAPVPVKQIITTINKMVVLFTTSGPTGFDSFLVFDIPETDTIINVQSSQVNQFSLNIGTRTITVKEINSIFYNSIEDKIFYAIQDDVSGNTYITYTGYGVYPVSGFTTTTDFVSAFGSVKYFGTYFNNMDPSPNYYQNLVYLSGRTLIFVGSYQSSQFLQLDEDATGFGYSTGFGNQISNLVIFIGTSQKMLKASFNGRNQSYYLLGGAYSPSDLTQDFYNNQIFYSNSKGCT